jgi:4-amino-4-deoxy-L-arabinose transferase-like glycosyltransferase
VSAAGERRRILIIVAGALAAIVALLGVRRAVAVDPLARLRADETGRHGSWWFPRGGPYILGYESPAPAELVVDGQRVAIGPGRQAQRVVFAAGAHAVTFRGPREARLLWHPPGRRGALEYVPASSLAPEPPETARFGGGAGASRGDAAIATGIVLVLVAAGLLLARPRWRSWRRREDWAPALGVLALALAVRFWGLSAAGQTWDEDEYWSSGRNYLVNLLALDFRDASWKWNFEHPPVTKYLAGLGALWQDGYGAARAIFALVSAGTAVLAWAIARRLFGGAAGLTAGVIVALTPHLVGHARVVGHETPSVFFWTLGVWLALRCFDDDGALVRRRLVWVGVALGLACATRFANLLLSPVLGLTLLAMAPAAQRRRTVAWGLALGPAAALATFVAVWPRLWTRPFAHLDEAWQKLRLPHSLEPYLGRMLLEPPWHYFVVYVLAVTPVVVLAAALAGGAWRGPARRERGWIVVLVWLVAPFGIGWSPVRQDGVRYVLPVLVPLAIAAGAGAAHAGAWAAERLRKPRAAWALGGVLGLYLVVTCARIAPYYIDYYGEAVGGAGRAQVRKLFEVGWWGEGIGEAVAYTNTHAAPGARLYKLMVPTHVNWFREDLWRAEVAAPFLAEWIVVNDAGIRTAGGRFALPPDAELVHDVRAGGASLARVYRRAPKSPTGEGVVPSR